MQTEFITSSDNRRYSIDEHGIINQLDARPFTYDEKYVSTYDTPEYKSNALQLQAMRYGFVCAAHGAPISSLLDYGCGNGEFLKYAARGINKVSGLDVSGIKHIADGIPVLNFTIPANVYTFWDVVEHIPNLNLLARLNCDTVCFSVPNCIPKSVEDFDSWYHRKPDEHLHHFNHNSLMSIMYRYGWLCVAVSYHEDIIRKRETQRGIPNILSMAFGRK